MLMNRRERAAWNALGQTHSITSTALDHFDYTQIASTSSNPRHLPHQRREDVIHVINESNEPNELNWVMVGALNAAGLENDARVGTGTKASTSTGAGTVTGKECVICREVDVAFASTPPTDKCLHQPLSCVSCVGKTIEVAVKSGGKTDNIQCPNCTELFDYESILHWADPATFERYVLFLL